MCIMPMALLSPMAIGALNAAVVESAGEKLFMTIAQKHSDNCAREHRVAAACVCKCASASVGDVEARLGDQERRRRDSWQAVGGGI